MHINHSLVETLETDKTQGRDSQELKAQRKGGTYYAPTHGHTPPCLLGRCSGVDGEAMRDWTDQMGLGTGAQDCQHGSIVNMDDRYSGRGLGGTEGSVEGVSHCDIYGLGTRSLT